MRRRLFVDTGDSRWGNLEEPKSQRNGTWIIVAMCLGIVGVGPGLYQGIQKTEQEWEERGGRILLPPGRILSEDVRINGKVKVQMLLSDGAKTITCSVRKGAPIICIQE